MHLIPYVPRLPDPLRRHASPFSLYTVPLGTRHYQATTSAYSTKCVGVFVRSKRSRLNTISATMRARQQSVNLCQDAMQAVEWLSGMQHHLQAEQQAWADQKQVVVAQSAENCKESCIHQVATTGTLACCQRPSESAVTSTTGFLPAEQGASPLQSADSTACSDASGDGWFSRCRGCGCMTAHEQVLLGAEMPFCRRCQTILSCCTRPGMRAQMVDSLIYVHQAWSSHGF